MLAVGPVVRAAQLERQLQRLHERGGADHVVVVGDAPARVRVLVPEQPLRVEQRRVLRQVLAVHDQVLPVHVDLNVRDPARAKCVNHVKRHAHVAHEDLHRGLGVLVLEEELDPVVRAALRDLAHAVDEARPGLRVGRLERVVVALDPGPEDHLRADRGGEVRGVERLGQRVAAHRVVGRGEPALAVARVQVRAGGDRVDAVAVQGLAHLVEVRRRELLGVVELVVVHQVAEALDGAVDLLRGGLDAVLGLVAARHEAGDHGPEGPDADARLQGHVGSFRSAER